MKISLAWLFDHIVANWRGIDIQHLVDQLSLKVAEVDGYRPIKCEPSSFLFATVIDHTEKKVVLRSNEVDTAIELTPRKGIKANGWYLLHVRPGGYEWATLQDCGAEKDGLMPAIYIENGNSNDIKKDTEWHDYILEIDNTAITNRPDLWGHRGWAREVAALLDLNLIAEEELISPLTIKQYHRSAPASAAQPFSLEISEAESACGVPCRRFAGLYINSIKMRPSSLRMALRLARLDTRPHNFIVDATNYVMLDLSQPMHSFDADEITAKKIVTRCANKDEKMTLLDGEEITLTPEDYLITDGTKPLAVAGIMGGEASGVTEKTTSLLLESANFDPIAIRRTAARLKKRTEASKRFEKNLDPNQNTTAIERYVKLLQDAGIPFETTGEIVSLGAKADVRVIHLEHRLATRVLGRSLPTERIFNILAKLDFGVIINKQDGNVNDISYDVTVPTFRGTKDVTLPEDLAEEICRLVGYETITPALALRATEPFSFHRIRQLREIKRQLAYGMKMQEVQTYPFYDEEFLRKLEFEPENTIDIANPQSQNQRRLVTSLVPHLIKTILTNRTEQQSFGFFEYAPIWFVDHENPVEKQELAGIFYYTKETCDFYAHKAQLHTFCELIGIDVTWKKSPPSPTTTSRFTHDHALAPWYEPTTAATLYCNGRPIGRAGKIAPIFFETVGLGSEGFVFELDGAFLLDAQRPVTQFVMPPKFPKVSLDVSIFVPITKTVARLSEVIRSADKRIIAVELIDFYTKREWDDQKSLTFRYTVSNPHKTLESTEINAISGAVHAKLVAIDATIR